MTTIKTNNRTLLFVEVMNDAYNILIEDDCQLTFNQGDWEYDDLGKCVDTPIRICTFLGKSKYRFIATTDTITEEQAAMFVGKGRVGYAHYGERVKHYNSPLISAMMANGGSVEIYYTTALESFESLLQHHSITGRHAIIEVI